MNQAIHKLGKRLAESPGNCDIRFRYAELLRQAGKLEAAAAEYAKCRENSKADYLFRLLTGQESRPHDDTSDAPAPIRIIPEFLPPEEHQTLLDFALSNQTNYSLGKVCLDNATTETYDPDVKRSLDLTGAALAEIRKWYKPRVFASVEALSGMVEFRSFAAETKISMKLKAYGEEDMYMCHRDGQGEGTGHHNLTTVYHFFKQPRAFTGGDLLLFDTNLDEEKPTPSYTRIPIQDNALIVFPSKYYHQVLPVRDTGHRFENSRFAVTAWLHNDREGP